VDQWLLSARRKLKRKNKNINFKNNRLDNEKTRVLMDFFNNISYRPGPLDIEQLAKRLCLNEKKVYSWFVVQRFKEKQAIRPKNFPNSANQTINTDETVNLGQQVEPISDAQAPLLITENQENTRVEPSALIMLEPTIKLPTVPYEEACQHQNQDFIIIFSSEPVNIIEDKNEQQSVGLKLPIK
jgi:phage antirepressor YoqD-like protein